ncbi:MAG: hypothetical protein J6M02_01710 [Clostridia bacterium]|nr:hypothetical protein [Clostridia bacterium]
MKKLMLAVLCMMSLIFTNVSFADDYEYPRIIFKNQTEITKVKAGDSFELTLTVQNAGDEAARDIYITQASKDAPIYWETAVDTYTIYRMSAGFSKEIKLELRVKETADNGIYALPFNIKYANYYGNEYTTEQTVYFEVVEELAKPLLIVRNIDTNPAIVTADSENTLSFELYNRGELVARRVKMTLKGLSKDGFMVKDAIDTKYFDYIDAGKGKNIKFDLLVSENIPKGTNELSVELEYFDQDNKSYTDSKSIYINKVQGKEGDSGKGTPKLIISSYDANPNSVVAGNAVEFTFTVKNTHASKKITNMKATINPDEATFVIEGGSNSFYVPELAAQEEYTKTIRLRTKQDTLSRAYPVVIAFDYEDAEGTAFTASETINLAVVEKSKLSINNVSGPYELYQGNSGYVSFEYYNMGKATISNLNVTVEGDYTAKNESTYIGNVDAGKGSFSEVEVVANVPGEAKGKLIFSFEDSSGNVIKTEKEFSGYVYEDMPMNNFDDSNMPEMPMVEPEEEGMAWWQLLLIGLGSCLVTLIIVRFITIKIMMKKIEDEI